MNCRGGGVADRGGTAAPFAVDTANAKKALARNPIRRTTQSVRNHQQCHNPPLGGSAMLRRSRPGHERGAEHDQDDRPPPQGPSSARDSTAKPAVRNDGVGHVLRDNPYPPLTSKLRRWRRQDFGGTRDRWASARCRPLPATQAQVIGRATVGRWSVCGLVGANGGLSEPLSSLRRRVVIALSRLNHRVCGAVSGGGGIRTHGRGCTPSPVFKTGAFGRSATPPAARR